MDLDDFVQQYPDFHLEDKLLLQGGRDVMYGVTFGRRQRNRGAGGKAE
jgi:hypothetical protein